MTSFSEFKETPDDRKAELIKYTSPKDILHFLDQKTDDKDNPSLAQLCFSKLELRNACLGKLTELAKAAKQQNDKATIESINRVMGLQDSFGHAGWHYLATHNKLEEMQLLLAVADIESFNRGMAGQSKQKWTGWHALARYQGKSLACIKAFMSLADTKLFNQAMLSMTQEQWTGWHIVARYQTLPECIEVFTNLADVRLFHQAMATSNAVGETGWSFAANNGLSGLINKLNIFYCSDMSLAQTDLTTQQIKLRALIFKDPIGFIYAAPQDFVATIKNCVNTVDDLATIKKLESALEDCIKKINDECKVVESKLDEKVENVEQRKRLLKNVEKKLVIQKQQLMVKKGLMCLRKFNDVTVRQAAFQTEDLVEARKCFMEFGVGNHSHEVHKAVGFALIEGFASFINSGENGNPSLPAGDLLLALSLSGNCYRAFMEGLTHFQKALNFMDNTQTFSRPYDTPLPLDLPDEHWITVYKACLDIDADKQITARYLKAKFEETINALAAREAALPAKWRSLSDVLKTIPGKLEPADKKFLTAFAEEKFRYEISCSEADREQRENKMRILVADYIKVKQSKGPDAKLFQTGIPLKKLQDIQTVLERNNAPKPKFSHSINSG